MPNYKFKAEVLRLNICPIVRQYDFLNKDTDFIKYIDIERQYLEILTKYGKWYIKEARRINNASFKRVNRLRERIRSYLGMGQCIFVTLTFTDDVLKCTKFETRRKYVARYLKSQSKYYLANVDYGNDDRYTHREHYHALIVSDNIDPQWWNDNFGFTWLERIHRFDDKILAKYVSKLCNHAIKDSTKRNCYIYSRS